MSAETTAVARALGRLEMARELAASQNERRIADRIDGYDRDDLGLSPDY